MRPRSSALPVMRVELPADRHHQHLERQDRDDPADPVIARRRDGRTPTPWRPPRRSPSAPRALICSAAAPRPCLSQVTFMRSPLGVERHRHVALGAAMRLHIDGLRPCTSCRCGNNRRTTRARCRSQPAPNFATCRRHGAANLRASPPSGRRTAPPRTQTTRDPRPARRPPKPRISLQFPALRVRSFGIQTVRQYSRRRAPAARRPAAIYRAKPQFLLMLRPQLSEACGRSAALFAELRPVVQPLPDLALEAALGRIVELSGGRALPGNSPGRRTPPRRRGRRRSRGRSLRTSSAWSAR